MSFASLGLSAPIVRAVSERGYTQPTPIQAQAIPAVLSGGDLLAGAQTGTGKTAGFTLPILQRLTDRAAKRGATTGRQPIRALVLTPTRELAAQVEESVREYSKYLQLSSTVVFGGVSINPQIARFKKTVDILVATPGRLLDHVQQKTVDLSQVEILVLDEADRMLDMGFVRDIKKVLALLPKKIGDMPRQNLLFSATFSDEIKALADSLLNNPALIEVARRNATAELVTQKVMLIDKGAKRALLSHLIKQNNWHQVLVFMRTKHGANRLAEQLGKDGISALAIHGNKSQGARTRALAEFKSGDLQVLVATDIAARGLDIEQLPHVVNFELPNVPEDYVHRIGRTGRAGASGEALSLVSPDEADYLRDIERLIKRTLPRETVTGFAASAEDLAPRPPRPQGRSQQKPKQGATSAPRGDRSRSGNTGNSNSQSGQKKPAPTRGANGNTRGGRQEQSRSGNTQATANKPRRAKPANGNAAPANKPARPPAQKQNQSRSNGNTADQRAPAQDKPTGIKASIVRSFNALRGR
ncbi:MAG: DEAD/DEAH box helicase [Burkholderiaceae bacterium]|nr:MAG: DEAD/DEAH box helicase [Burkholderiaceae bacterium]